MLLWPVFDAIYNSYIAGEIPYPGRPFSRFLLFSVQLIKVPRSGWPVSRALGRTSRTLLTSAKRPLIYSDKRSYFSTVHFFSLSSSLARVPFYNLAFGKPNNLNGIFKKNRHIIYCYSLDACSQNEIKADLLSRMKVYRMKINLGI